MESWKDLLSEEDKEQLKALAPSDSVSNFDEALRYEFGCNSNKRSNFVGKKIYICT